MQIRIQAIILNTFWAVSYIQLIFLVSLSWHMCRLLKMLFCTKFWIICPVMIYSQQMLYSKYATSAVLHGYIFIFAWIPISSTEYSKQNLAKNASALFLAATVGLISSTCKLKDSRRHSSRSGLKGTVL